jgi:ATP-dependent DNA ligase
VSETFDQGRQLFEAVSKMGLEGIVAKKRSSHYLPGKRTSEWIKIKTRRTVDCIILGYTKGKGEREPTFGALQLGCYRNGDLVYIGKVGTGFDERLRKNIFADLANLERVERQVAERPIDDSQTIWLEPEVICEVQYASIVKGHLREPVFLRLRPDLSLEDCQMS